VNPSFLRPEAYKIFVAVFVKKEYKKSRNTKLGTKVNIYLGPLPEAWKGP
jgi:hypothetical protein